MAPQSVPSSNILRDDGHTIVQRIIVQGDFDDFQKQVEFMNKMQAQYADNLEAQARAAGQLAAEMDPLIAVSAKNLDVQQRLLEGRQRLIALSKAGAAPQTIEEARSNVAMLTGLQVASGAIIPTEFPGMRIPGVTQTPEFQQFQQLATNPPTGLEAGTLQQMQMGTQQLSEGSTMPGWQKLLDVYEVLSAETGQAAKRHKVLLDKLTTLLEKLNGQATEQIRKTGEAARGGPGEPGEGGQSFQPFRRLGKGVGQDVEHGAATRGERILQQALGHLPGGAEGTLGKAISGHLDKIAGAIPLIEKAAPIIGAGAAGWDVIRGAVQNQRQYLGETGTTTMRESEGYDIRARVMALSPFVSDQQAREIIQGTLQQGFRGQTADNAIDFAVDNFKRFNMNVGSSMRLFQAGAIDAGASVQQLSGSLNELQQTARVSQQSWSSLTQNQAQNVSALAGLGAGAASVSTGTALAGLSAADQMLSQHGYNLGSALQSPAFQMLLAHQLGTSPSMLGAKLGQMGKSAGGTVTLTQDIIRTAQNALIQFGRGVPPRGLHIGMTQQEIDALPDWIPDIVNAAGLGRMSYEEAKHVVNLILGTKDPVQAMQQRQRQANQQQSEGLFGRLTHAAGSVFHGVVGDVQGIGSSSFFSNSQQVSSAIQGAEAETGQNMPLVEQWFRDLQSGQGPGFGSTAVEYQGKTYMFQDFYQKFGAKGMLALQQGKAKVAGAGHGLKGKLGQFEDVSQWVDPNLAAAMGQTGYFDKQGHEVHVTIGFAPGADRLIRVQDQGVTAVGNAESSGYGFSSTNNTPTTRPNR